MIRPNEIRTTTIAAAIVIIAATTVMISTAVAIRTAIGIKTAIGIGIKTAIASIRTETVIVTMTRITTAIIARTAAEDLTAETASVAVACRRRIRADLTAITRAESDIAEVTIKARPRAWTDACGTFTRITGFESTFHKTRKNTEISLDFSSLEVEICSGHQNSLERSVKPLLRGIFARVCLVGRATIRGSTASFCGKGL